MLTLGGDGRLRHAFILSRDLRPGWIRRILGLNRTLLVVESKTLLEGQKRGIAVALSKAQRELVKLERHVETKKISRSSLEQRVKKALRREHLSAFVVTDVGAPRPSRHSPGASMPNVVGNSNSNASDVASFAPISTPGAASES